MIEGPTDSGKTTLIRTALRRLPTGDATYIDHDHFGAQVETRIVVLDDLDISPHERISSLQAAYRTVSKTVPRLLDKSAIVVILIESSWSRRFEAAYRQTFVAFCRMHNPGIAVFAHYMRPYAPKALSGLLGGIGDLSHLDAATQFYPGTVALYRQLIMEEHPSRLSTVHLLSIEHQTWVAKATSASPVNPRAAIMRVLSLRSLNNRADTTSVSDLQTASRGQLTRQSVLEHASGPIVARGHQIGFRTMQHSDVAAARSLIESVTDQELIRLQQPVPVRIAQHASELLMSESPASPTDLVWKIDQLRYTSFQDVGYYACALAWILMSLNGQDTVVAADLSNLDLRGASYHDSSRINKNTQQHVNEILTQLLSENADSLLTQLRAIESSATSCYRGGRSYWQAGRTWAANLPIRTAVENFALSEMLVTNNWRYEDILDVSVTEASTYLLHNADKLVKNALGHRAAPHVEILSDLWDGLNDGCWDQVVQDRREYIDAFAIECDPSGWTVDLSDTCLERARFGSASLRSFNLSGADLTLADLRSCAHVPDSIEASQNWWQAILAPDHRYALSRAENRTAFLEWCGNPPWINPYYTHDWPRPLGEV